MINKYTLRSGFEISYETLSNIGFIFLSKHAMFIIKYWLDVN